MTEIAITPRDYGLPHDTWRTGQEDAIKKVLALKDNETLIVQAPTGSGKTTFAAAYSSVGKVMALSHTKLLQANNYAATYDFTALYGKGNYTCAATGESAQMCEFKTTPKQCPQYSECQYYVEKAKAMAAQKTALNYAYFTTARWPRQLAPNGLLALDEAHLLSDLVVERASVTIQDSERRDYDLPEFPNITTKGRSMLFDSDPVGDAIKWLNKVRVKLKINLLRLERMAQLDKEAHKQYDKVLSLSYRVEGTLQSLETSPQDWFIRSGPRAREVGRRRVPGFICKPLTARHHFPNQFILGGPTLLMSATIGNFDTFTTELGITDYQTLRVPSVWKPEVRPVYYHSDAPSMGRKTDEEGYDKQAELISKMIRETPSNWSGVVHVTSKYQAEQLYRRLARNGLRQRIWLPPLKDGTEKQLSAWQWAKREHEGRLAIAWSWWVGVDLLDEKIAICAKTPYPFLGGEFERARMQYDGKMYLQRTAWRLQQGCGRTRRGRLEDYDTNGQRNGLVAIIDSNWTRVKKYMDDDFVQSMREW